MFSGPAFAGKGGQMTHTVSQFKEVHTQLLHTQRGLVFVAAVGLAFAYGVGGDHEICFAASAVTFFLVVVLLLS
jgi:hypothetical protein